jgi:hypothetical protein
MAEVAPRSAIQEVASKLAEVIRIGSPHQRTFLEQVELLLFEVEGPLKRRLDIEKDAVLENAQKKMRDAKIAFDKLSDQQRNLIHLTIQDTQTTEVTIRFLPNGSTEEIAGDTPWRRPEDLISGIIEAFANSNRQEAPQRHYKPLSFSQVCAAPA